MTVTSTRLERLCKRFDRRQKGRYWGLEFVVVGRNSRGCLQGYNTGRLQSRGKTPMSQILKLEISEQVFTAMRIQAEAIGIAPEHLAASLIEQQFIQAAEELSVSEAGREAARLKFEGHFGTIGIEGATDIDNESIDADLAREYAN